MSHLARGLILAAVFACPNALSSHADEATGDDGGPASQADEILDGPFEGASATDEVFSPEGITGDWGGYRAWLSGHGLELSADLTTTLQGVMDGGFDEAARIGGSSELILDIDIEKLGLWPGGFARVAAEGRFGDDVVGKAGTLSPVNADAIFPADPDKMGEDLFALTEMNATQFLLPWLGIYGGLLNTTSGDANEYAGFARSNEHFWNLGMLMSLVSMQVVPNVTLGGGLVVIPFEGMVGSFTFMNTEESAGSNPFKTDEGWTAVTEWAINHNLLGLPVEHVVSFAFAFDNDFFKFEDPRLEYQLDDAPILIFSSKDESWAFWYNGRLSVWTHDEDEDRSAGIFVRFGYADEDTNPIEWNISAGIGGVGIFDLRPKDRFGIGVYHIEPSNGFPLPQLGIGKETGFEMFYNIHLLQGATLSADLQYIDTSFGQGDFVTRTPGDAWVGGLRLRIVF